MASKSIQIYTKVAEHQGPWVTGIYRADDHHLYILTLGETISMYDVLYFLVIEAPVNHRCFIEFIWRERMNVAFHCFPPQDIELASVPPVLPRHIVMLLGVKPSFGTPVSFVGPAQKAASPPLWYLFTLIDEYNILFTIIMNFIYRWHRILENDYFSQIFKNLSAVSKNGALWYPRELYYVLPLILKYSLPCYKTSQHFSHLF